MDIHHIGCSSFKSSFNSKVLSLNQLLHVPSITKNLLSVSKFAADNKVYFVFFPNNCSVHDQVSHNILMEGKLQDGHYAFDPPQFISKPQIQSSQRPFPSTYSQIPSCIVNKDSVSSVLYSESSNTLDQCQNDPFNVWRNRL